MISRNLAVQQTPPPPLNPPRLQLKPRILRQPYSWATCPTLLPSKTFDRSLAPSEEDHIKIRLATFQDNLEKCKGFGYVDYEDVEDAKAAFGAKNKHFWEGRPMRVEYAGELATKKGRPWEHFPVPAHIAEKSKSNIGSGQSKRKRSREQQEDGDRGNEENSEDYDDSNTKRNKMVRQDRDLDTDNMAETKLQGLPVQFKGQKTTFD